MAETPLPPWLTRQYDYATGLRDIGKTVANNLQRNRALELQAQSAQAQQQSAAALEQWRMAQAQALQEKQAQDAKILADNELVNASFQKDMIALGDNPTSNQRLGVYFKHLPAFNQKGIQSSLPNLIASEFRGIAAEDATKTRKDIADQSEAGRDRRLDKTLQNKLDIKALEFGTQGEEGDSQWDTKTFPSGHVGIRLRGSKTWKLIKPDDLNDVEKITLLDLNKSIRDLQNSLTKVPINPDGTIPPERSSLLKQIRNLQGDKSSFLERRAEGKEPESKLESPKKTKSGKDIPEGYVRVRVKATGTKAWADPETAKSAEYEIIEEE